MRNRKMTLSSVDVVWTIMLVIASGYCNPLSQNSNPVPPDAGYCSIPLAIARDSINIQVGFTISSDDRVTSGGSTHAASHADIPQDLHDRTYIQVEFQTQMLISGIITQGSPTTSARVTHFKILYSSDCMVFTPIQDRHNLQARVFAANLDPNTTTTTMFGHVFYALCVRVVPTRRIGDETAMRFELLGCQSSACTRAIVPRSVEEDLYWKKVTFDAEKMITSIKIVLNPLTTQGTPVFFIVYSRTCNFDDSAQIIQENNVPVVFMPDEGAHVFTVNRSHMPIRAQCLAVYIPDRERVMTRSVHIGLNEAVQRSAVEEFSIEVEGCDALENHASVSSCGNTRLREPDVTRRSSRRREKRVVRGDPVTAGEYPWLVSLHFLAHHDFTASSGLHHLCGASLISDQWVMTAAHCLHASGGDGLDNKDNWVVVLGEHHQDSYDGTEQYIPIEKIILHPEFVVANNTPILHDIALIKLVHPATLSDYVNPICIEPDHVFPDHTNCVTAGWGYLKVENGVGVELPNFAQVRIIPQRACAEKYNILPDDHEAKIYVRIDDSVMCAMDDENGGDSCWGDSGGPLMCYHDDHWNQAGIVSLGYECGNSLYPAVYTNVNYFADWIGAVIANNTATSG